MLPHIHGRPAFARRFAQLIGEAPLSYLTRWRMGVGARLLRETDLPLSQIAARVGYDSEFSFSRAFKRNRGTPPNAFRHSQELDSPRWLGTSIT